MSKPRNWGRIIRAFIPAIAIAIFVLGIGAAAAAGNGANQTSTATVNVAIGDNTFTPKSVTVNVGDTVVWTNNGKVPHDVTALTGGFASARNLAPGASYSFTATTAGTFNYICTIHTGQDGTLIVQAAPTAAPSTAPTASSAPSATTVPAAAPNTGGGGFRAAIQPWQQLVALGALVAIGALTLLGRRLRRAA